MEPGDKVEVRLSNGYRMTGVILRAFKNGSFGVREIDRGRNSKGRVRYHVRFARELRPIPEPEEPHGA